MATAEQAASPENGTKQHTLLSGSASHTPPEAPKALQKRSPGDPGKKKPPNDAHSSAIVPVAQALMFSP